MPGFLPKLLARTPHIRPFYHSGQGWQVQSYIQSSSTMSITASEPLSITSSSEPHQHPPRQARHVRRGNLPGLGGLAHPARAGLLALRPASVLPPTHSPASIPQSNGPQNRDPPLSNRHNRRREGGPAVRQPATLLSGRKFGGALTKGEEAEEDGVNSGSGLQGDAPEFRPGQTFSIPVGPRAAAKHQQPKKRRSSKSTAPDIATRVHEDIDHRQYECPICTSEVLRSSKIWSCHTCWTVFHLSCIKQWSSNAGSEQQNGQNGDNSLPRQWRCPGCNLPQDVKPSTYTCWCGKEVEPRSISGIPPHSCGQTCGKSRIQPKKCPHPCELLCHAGPCPPCTHIGPKQSCFCGKESTTRRCVETFYESGWSCGKPCGDVMPCQEHNCTRKCHEGLCGACEVGTDARCYCGKEEKVIQCCDKDEELTTNRTLLDDTGKLITEGWDGKFQCTAICERAFDCGKHRCQKPCHAQPLALLIHCPSSPDLVTHCPCGKTKLGEISNFLRQSCDDTIPSCAKFCLRSLPCGHLCQQLCHSGECLPCLQTITVHCRCGRIALSSICHQGFEESPQCTRTCHTTLNCGRHECGERCCAGERRAGERQSARRKLKPLNHIIHPGQFNGEFEAEHICTRLCGRALRCGNHVCQELCHKGPCGSCREAIFDEISCHCGRTVLQPPLPCGTKQPPCRYDCGRPKTCGHPQIAHNCHTDDETCPKCPYLTEKVCMCGKKTLKNQQCWVSDVRCGEICGKRLRCGSHTCRKTCHKLGECEDKQVACQQSCGKSKKTCGHPCEDLCHAPYPCHEDKPCMHKILITCDCQHKKQEMRCNALKSNEGNIAKSLNCDDECARLERNRKLASALNINPNVHKDDHVPYSQETLSLFQDNPKWAQDQEREFRVFAIDEDEKRLRFKPMPANQRAFLHNLAEDFGFDSESMDPEPHRHVALFKTPRFVSAPTKTLKDCVKIRNNQKAAAATEAHSKTRASNINEPYNGFLLINARFGLTLDEIQTELASVQGPSPKLHFHIRFLRGDEVALKASIASQTERTIDMSLKNLKLPLVRSLQNQGFGHLQLCRFDESLNILGRESDDADGGGWSQVAAKAVAPRSAPQTEAIGSRSSFAVLTSLNNRKKAEAERKARESVVDDWETAAVDEAPTEMVANETPGASN